MATRKATVKELLWQDVRDSVASVNPEFAKIIDDFKPTKDCTFIKIRYPYGYNVFKRSVCAPRNGSSVTVKDGDFEKSVKNALDYSPLPIGIVMKKTVEMYYETHDRIMPIKLYKKGQLIGVKEFFDTRLRKTGNLNFKLSAGSRSIFMLPKISDASSHARLRRDYGIRQYAPKSLINHQSIFVEMYQVAEQSNWNCEVLFLSGGWLKSKHAMKLYHYFLQQFSEESSENNVRMVHDPIWEKFAQEVSRRNWRVRPYTLNTLKHLISISEGILPAFVPAENDETAPVDFIQKAYMETYMLKRYYPVLMYADRLRDLKDTAYYSISFPTLIEWGPRVRVSNSIMTEIKDIKALIDLYVNSTNRPDLQFEFFHTELDKLQEIKPSLDIPEIDSRFTVKHYKNKHLSYSENSPYLKGCIRVHKNSSDESVGALREKIADTYQENSYLLE